MFKLFLSTALLGCIATPAVADGSHENHIISPKTEGVLPEFDLIHAKVFKKGADLVFQQEVLGTAGATGPHETGALAGAGVYSYVWPTNLDSKTVGFEPGQGTLALALTVHPDFDDTPLYDEDGDGNRQNDGDKWHSHWVVLVPDNACGKGSLKVKDIAGGSNPAMPKTWPGLPIFIDSPGYEFSMKNSEIRVQVPLKSVGFEENFNFDSVTAGLKVNEQVHSPLLCVANVWDIGSGNLSLPGKVK